MKNITSTLHTLHNLSEEAKAEERKIEGKHRKAERTPLSHHIHRTAVHFLHTGQQVWLGLPAILAFEAARPAWQRFVETPIADLMFGNHGSSTVHAASTVAQHFIG